MLAGTATLIGAVSAAAATGSLLTYLYALRRDDRSEARAEALALAETRAQVIADLRRHIGELERRNKRMRRAYEKRIRELEDALAARGGVSRTPPRRTRRRRYGPSRGR